MIVFLLAVLAGCIPVPRGDNSLDVRFMSSEELRELAEKTFRHQNRVTTRLMMSLDYASISDDDLHRIERAESRMNRACASLNEVASARASNQEVEFGLEDRVRRNVRLCAARTDRLERILDDLGI